MYMQAEEFFAPLPQAITSCLRSAACIATEDKSWVLPAEAVMCNDTDAAARQLLAHATSMGITGTKYIDPGLTVLHSSSALRSALGIKTLDVEHLLYVLHSAHAQGMFVTLGVAWCAQMLACVFDMLAAKEPHLHSMRAQDLAHSTAGQAVYHQLAGLPMFLLTSGTWVAPGTDPDMSLFTAMAVSPTPASISSGTKSGEAPESPGQTQQAEEGLALQDALERCQLTIHDMPLRIIATDFLAAAGEGAGSLSKMLQVGPVSC